MKTFYLTNIRFLICFLSGLFSTGVLNAAIKNSISSGNWSTATTWSPAGIPQAGDEVIINPSHIIKLSMDAGANTLNVKAGAEFNLATGYLLTLQSDLTVNGKFSMNGGDINMVNSSAFVIGPNATFTWDPGNNSNTGATLFTNGFENFDSTSTLIIKKWYDYTNIPLASVVSGNFGNVTLNSLSGNLLYQWNQNNQFETHKVLGTLTIEQGWIILDKSGSISNTTIGSINLSTPNAYLDFHNGNHNGSFTVGTGNITNTGGELIGIYNGNGNITLNVSGNFINKGSVVMIYNTGVPNVGNGNATVKVSGEYNQSGGDFRTIFNLTTSNAGIADLTFNNINLTGGIWMGQYACNTNGDLSTCTVNGNLYINFTNASGIFRVNGLTSLSGIFNNSKTSLTVNGNLIIAGNPSAEFTSSGSIGAESISINGNILISSGTNNFNMGSHQLSLNTIGGVIITGGHTSFSKSPGIFNSTIQGNFSQSGGVFSIKGNSGAAEMVVKGNFNITGGTALLHSNLNAPSTDVVKLILKGNFSHTGGIINYDDNVNSVATHTIQVTGPQYNIGGNGIITRSGAGLANVFGLLNFSKTGVISFHRSGTSHTIQQVKQVVQNGCSLMVVNGNLQVASHSIASCDYLKIAPGGTLIMGLAKIITNTQGARSGIKVENNGRLTLQNTNGLYNGFENACISASSNMNYYLAPQSIVEYCGNDSQVLTGIGLGLATTNDHKYGILEINFNGTPDDENVFLTNSNVFVRTALRLIKGQLKLANNTITIEVGNASAISKIDGYIKSESSTAESKSFIKWLNMDDSLHVFPFGTNRFEYLPFSFTPVSGMGGAVSVATRASGPDNLPLPSGGILPAVTNLKRNGIDIAVSSVIDRWYHISAPGYRANVILMYRGSENTLADSLADSNLAMQAWDGSKWANSAGSGSNVRQGIGTVSVNNATVFNHWIISTPTQFHISTNIISFDAVIHNNSVELDWAVNSVSQIRNFIVETSVDDITYQPIGNIPVQYNNGEDGKYSILDEQPAKGISYYRITQENNDGKIYFSNTETINNDQSYTAGFAITSIAPNPFSDHFTVLFTIPREGITTFQLTNSAGQVIKTEQITGNDIMNKYEYSEKQNLMPGIYVLTLKYGNSVITCKLFKSGT
ncbi:MAG: beta strand repeat-containing protein [Bacteroidia bacterium]